MMALIDFLEWLFSRKKTNVYTTFNMGIYYKVAGRLKEAGIPYRTSVRTQNAQWGAHNNEYKIYVKNEDKHRADQAIHLK
jgi:hypothetical protein